MYYYIINPASGFGKINKIQDQLKEILTNLGIAGEFAKTTGPKDATKLAKLAISKGYNTIIAVGGDNTVNEVVNGIVDKKVALGIIPTGATNSVAKTLGIFDWQEACSILAARRIETIDLGKANGHYFIANASIGFEAEIIKYRSETGFWPKIKFLKRVFSELNTFKSQGANINFDGELDAKTPLFALIIANCYPSGLGKLFKPNPQDGFLDTLLVSKISKLEAIKKIKEIIQGDYEGFSETSVFKSKKIIIETREPLSISLDGEFFEKTPIEIEIVPKKLRVIVSKKRQF